MKYKDSLNGKTTGQADHVDMMTFMAVRIPFLVLLLLLLASCSTPKLTAKGKRTLRESGYGSDKCHEKKEWLPEMIKI